MAILTQRKDYKPGDAVPAAVINDTIDTAITALDKVTTLTAQASSLAAGAAASANVTTLPDGKMRLNLGIPKGDKGDKGDIGVIGPQGIQGVVGPQGQKGDSGVTYGALPLAYDFGSGQNALSVSYKCNGVNDNEILTQISKDFYTNGDQNDNASMKIIVNGVVGITAVPLSSYPLLNSTSEGDAARFFDFGVDNYAGTRKFVIDFSNATVPKMTYIVNFGNSRYCALIYSSGNIVIENANIDFEFNNTGSGASVVYGFFGGDTYINCTGNVSTSGYGKGYGFYGGGAYTNCNGTGTGYNEGFGFCGGETYTNCTGIGIGTGTGYHNGYGFGFYGGVTYTNCNGTGTGGDIANSYAYGFYSNSYSKTTYINCVGEADNASLACGFVCYGSGTYINCMGSGSGFNSAYGFYFSSFNSNDYSQYIFCMAMAHIPDTKSVNASNCVPIYNGSTSANLYTTVTNCRFPSLTWGGHKQGIVWYSSNITNTTIAGALRDNVYNGTQFTGGTNGVSKGSANLITDNNANVAIT